MVMKASRVVMAVVAASVVMVARVVMAFVAASVIAMRALRANRAQPAYAECDSGVR